MELLERFIPNVMSKPDELIESCWQTFVMVGISGGIAFVLGLLFGVCLVVCAPGKVLENKVIYNVLDKVTNIFRSIPFIILLAALIPYTRMIVGTAIGTKGAIVPLVFGTVPFFSRQVETALAEIDHGLIEAAQSMGSSPFEITWRIYLRESIPGIIRACTITLVSLIGLTAMAGAVGGGGLGDFAIRYGHQRNQVDATYVVVIILLVVVTIVQSIGNYIIHKTTH